MSSPEQTKSSNQKARTPQVSAEEMERFEDLCKFDLLVKMPPGYTISRLHHLGLHLLKHAPEAYAQLPQVPQQ